MSDTQAKLGNALLKSLLGLREQKGEILIEDVGAILENVASTLNAEHSEADKFLRKEIKKMANYIIEAKKEIAALAPPDDETSHKNIGAATTQLSAVVKATEEAAGVIMDAADEIQAIAGKLPADGELTAKMYDISSRMYEACNFQDLTGQRINKVVVLLEHIEEKVSRLIGLFSDHPEGLKLVADSKDKKSARKDEHLLHGPALPDKAPSQNDIDALFASLGGKQ